MSERRRARRRPRVASVSFKSFGWLLRREAALHILYPGITQAPSPARVVLAGTSSTQLARMVTFKLNHRWHYGGTRR